MKRKIGLALSGGGARGFAHVGVLKVLAAHDIAFDFIAGTSAGSVVGAALGAGMTPDEIETMARKVGWLNTIRPALNFKGLLTSAPLGKLLQRELPVTRFEDMRIPFAAVAYDIVKGEEFVWKDQGDLIGAIRSSCAVPGIFAPMKHGDRILVDGGVTSVLPVDAVRAMGAEIVIGIDLLSCGNTYAKIPRTGMGIMIRSAMTLIRSGSNDQRGRSDVTIEPAIAHIRIDQLKRADELIRLGEEAALARIDEITDLVTERL
jgi:NTE family protein